MHQRKELSIQETFGGYNRCFPGKNGGEIIRCDQSPSTLHFKSFILSSIDFMVDNFASLFNCMTMGRPSDLMTACSSVYFRWLHLTLGVPMLRLTLCGFVCDVCFVVVCSSSLLLLLPREGCASCFWLSLSFFTYSFSNDLLKLLRTNASFEN